MSQVTYEDEEFEYGLTRVKSTVVLDLAGEPVYVTGGDVEDKALYGFPLKMGRNAGRKTLGIGFHNFNLTPFPLGYVNTSYGATYTSRSPVRYYKQGLDERSLFSSRYRVGLFSKALYNTIVNKYSTPEECFEPVVCGERGSLAFCRSFCFSRFRGDDNTVLLDFRGRTVGRATYTAEAGRINYQLYDKFSFLQETLEECMNNV